MNGFDKRIWPAAMVVALCALALIGAGCGDDDNGGGNAETTEAEAPSGPLTLEQVQSNLEDAGYYADPLEEGDLAVSGAVDGLRVGSDEDDGGFFGGYVYVYEEPVDNAAVEAALGEEPFEVGEGGFVFSTYGPNADENLQTLVEAAQGG